MYCHEWAIHGSTTKGLQIRSVPSSGRPGAQLGHHILVRHWLIFTFDCDRNGTGIIFRKSIGYFLGVDINCIIATHFIPYVVYAYIYIYLHIVYIHILYDCLMYVSYVNIIFIYGICPCRQGILHTTWLLCFRLIARTLHV